MEILAAALGGSLVATLSLVLSLTVGWPRWPAGVTPSSFPAWPRGFGEPECRKIGRATFRGGRVLIPLVISWTAFLFANAVWDWAVGIPSSIGWFTIKSTLCVLAGMGLHGRVVTIMIRRTRATPVGFA